MKMDIVAGSKNDEYFTPYYAIEPIIKYLNPGATIWTPFDKEESQYVKVFRKHGFTVINTHIEEGGDFFEIEPQEDIDYIVSNPPYSLKAEVLERMFDLKIPFALLLGVVGLFESQKRFNLFKNNHFEIMYLNRRVSFFKDLEDPAPSANPPYSSIYLTSGILPDRIIFEEINKKNLKL